MKTLEKRIGRILRKEKPRDIIISQATVSCDVFSGEDRYYFACLFYWKSDVYFPLYFRAEVVLEMDDRQINDLVAELILRAQDNHSGS